MPLIKGKSKESFGKNVSTEMHAGKPLKQSLAIAYAMKKKTKKMAGGGEIEADEYKSGYQDHAGNDVKSNHAAEDEDDMGYNQKMAQGGELEGKNEGMNFSMSTPDDMGESKQSDSLHDSVKGDIVDRIMRKVYAKGGPVEADTGEDELSHMADGKENDFDFLSTEDHDLDDSTTNSGSADGDDLDNKQEDEDRKDIVKRIMKQRSMKQTNPRPA